MQAARHDTQNSTGSIVSRPCKERKDGAPTFQIGKEEARRAGHPARDRPGRENCNISLFKNFPFNEDRGTNLQFRAEFFNIWNHPQWVGDALNGGISTNYGAGNFGAVTSAYDPRTIQLALKFSF